MRINGYKFPAIQPPNNRCLPQPQNSALLPPPPSPPSTLPLGWGRWGRLSSHPTAAIPPPPPPPPQRLFGMLSDWSSVMSIGWMIPISPVFLPISLSFSDIHLLMQLDSWVSLPCQDELNVPLFGVSFLGLQLSKEGGFCYCHYRPQHLPPNMDSLRDELEMDHDLPSVLLMGGGKGMGPVKKTARAFGQALFDEALGRPIGQIVIICDRNQALRSTLQQDQWKVPVKISGFENQMEKWMGACDCILTKAGPETIAEALIPIILNDFIPGREVGNIPYVVDNGAGLFSKSPEETANLVAQWIGPQRDDLNRMSENALKLARPDAVFNIVRDIDELA
ncbi:hypothetical protein ACLOJK_035835 [Asimina triloba]